MRLKPGELKQITGRSMPSAQARWFLRHFGVAPPLDEAGPILTRRAFDELVISKLGLKPAERPRPQVKTKGKT